MAVLGVKNAGERSNFPIISLAQGGMPAGSVSGGSSSDFARLSPQVRNPLLNVVNFYLPQDSKVLHQWCVEESTKILMVDGTLKKIKDIIPGDWIINGNGERAQVKRLLIRDVLNDEKVIKLKFTGKLDPLIITENHKVFILSKDKNVCNREGYVKYVSNGKTIYGKRKGRKCLYGRTKVCKALNCMSNDFEVGLKKAGDIEVGDYGIIPEVKEINSTLTKDEMRFLGFYTAEGFVNRRNDGHYGVCVGLNITERETLGKEFVELCLRLFGRKVHVCKIKDSNADMYTMWCKKAFNLVIQHVGRGARTKRLSEELMYANPKLQKEFLGSYILGDGSLSKNDNNEVVGVRWGTSNRQLASQLEILGLRCGFATKIYKSIRFNNYAQKILDSYYSDIPNDGLRILLPYINNPQVYAGCSQNLNRLSYYYCGHSAISQVTHKEVVNDFKGKVYNIEVEGNEDSYIANGIKVKNCRYYDRFDTHVGNSLDLHSEIIISPFELDGIEDTTILDTYKDVADKLDLFNKSTEAMREFYLLGECVKPGTKIMMGDGSEKNIEDVVRGDFVITHKGNIKKVTEKFVRYENEKLYNVKVKNYNVALECTGNHPIYGIQLSKMVEEAEKTKWRPTGKRRISGRILRDWMENNEIEFNFIETSNLKVGDWVAMPVLQEINEVKGDSKKWGRLIGYFASEGHVERQNKFPNHWCKVSWGNRDYEIVKDIVSCIRSVYGIEPKVKKRKDSTWIVTIYSSKITEEFANKCHGIKTNKYFSKDVLLMDPDLQIEILKSFILGDGSVEEKGEVRLENTSVNLINQLYMMVFRCGMIGSLYKRKLVVSKSSCVKDKYRDKCAKWIYTIKINRYDSIKLREDCNKLLKAGNFCKRVRNVILKNNCILREVKCLKEVKYNGPVYNLEVEDDNSYVANKVAVHNCFPFLQWNEQKGIFDQLVFIDPDYVHVHCTPFIHVQDAAVFEVEACLTGDTEVVMVDGTCKEIKNVIIGDEVWTHRGRIRKVCNNMIFDCKDGLREVFVGRGLDSIKMTKGHRMLVWEGRDICVICGRKRNLRSRKRFIYPVCCKSCGCKYIAKFKGRLQIDLERNNGSLVWKEAKDLEEGDFLVIPKKEEISNLNNVLDIFYEKDIFGKSKFITRGKARLLGYYLAEGHLKKYKNEKVEVGLTLNYDERDTWVKDIAELFKIEFDIDCFVKCTEKGHRSKISCRTNRELASWFYFYGGEYCDKKRLFKEVLDWPLYLQEEVLIGYLRGDGSDYRDRNIFFKTTSKVLYEQMCQIFANLGLAYTIDKVRMGHSKEHKKTYCSTIYRSINGGFLEKVKNKDLKLNTDLYDKVYKLINEGKHLKEICDIFKEEKIKNRWGNYIWYPRNIKNILRNKSYGFSNRLDAVELKNCIVWPIIKINDINYEGKVYDLTVEEDHSFLLKGSIVSSNSEVLRDFVNSTDPVDVKLQQYMDPHVRASVISGNMIKVSPFNMTALMKKASPYDIRGTSILLRCLKWLMLEDKYMEANFSIADGHVTPKWVFKLGDPANKVVPSKADLMAFREMLMNGWYDYNFAIISTYALQVEAIGSAGKILPIINEIQMIDDKILTALFTSKAAVSGEGPNFATAAVARLYANARYANRRALIETWHKRKIYEPIAKAHKFYESLSQAELVNKVRPSDKERKFAIPKINWMNKLDLTDTVDFRNYVSRMREQMNISMKTICRIFGLDYLEEEKSLLSERGTVFDPVYQDYRKKHADLIFKKREEESGQESIVPMRDTRNRQPQGEPGAGGELAIPGGAEEAEVPAAAVMESE